MIDRTTLARTETDGAVFDTAAEFERQVEVLVQKGYPALAGMTVAEFTALVAPLERVATRGADRVAQQTRERAPFVLVIASDLVSAGQAMPLVDLRGKPGFVDASAADIEHFVPIASLDLPPGPAYLLFDIDRGAETLDVRPDDALVTLTAQGRTPLTVAEGIALVTHHPEMLQKNHCFSLLGSRCGDRRVPALWISGARASSGSPKLGWCWAGNPHTWLGSASGGARAGVGPAAADPARE